VENGQKVKVRSQGDLFLKEANTGEVIKIQALVCPEFPKNIRQHEKAVGKRAFHCNGSDKRIYCNKLIRCQGWTNKEN
jgi:hypothetical protein